MDSKNVPPQITIELPEKESEGVYANRSNIIFSQSEFIIDFIKILPGMKKGKVVSRILMTPQNYKMLVKVLNDTMKKYEDQFGEIKVLEGGDSHSIGFKPE